MRNFVPMLYSRLKWLESVLQLWIFAYLHPQNMISVRSKKWRWNLTWGYFLALGSIYVFTVCFLYNDPNLLNSTKLPVERSFSLGSFPWTIKVLPTEVAPLSFFLTSLLACQLVEFTTVVNFHINMLVVSQSIDLFNIFRVLRYIRNWQVRWLATHLEQCVRGSSSNYFRAPAFIIKYFLW